MKIEVLYPHVAPPHEPIVAVADVAAYGVAAAAFIGWLPRIAAGLSVLYLTLQIILSLRNWRKNWNKD